MSLSLEAVERFDEKNLTVPVGSPEEVLLLERIFSSDRYAPMSDYLNVFVGEIDMTLDRDCKTTQRIADAPPLLKGAQVQRYEVREKPKQGDLEWVNWENFLKKYKTSSKMDVARKPRMVFQGISGTDDSRRLTPTIIPANVYLANSVNYIVSKTDDISLEYIQALFGSQLLEWRFRLTSTNNNINNYEVDSLPFRILEFNTPAAERDRLTRETIGAYDIGDNAGVLARTGAALDAGKSDVVHDLLAHLAQCMIDLNKQKQAEVKRFLGWLEGRLRIAPRNGEGGIDSLTGKTVIQGYLGDYQKGEGELLWREFLYRLHQNRNRFGVSLTDVEGEIEREYEKSLETLIPLKRNLARTDALIDKIVYRLYGLTDAEIELIERPQYEQALTDAKAQAIADETITADTEEEKTEQVIEKIAEAILPAAQRFFERIEPRDVEATLDGDLPNWRALPPDAPTFMLTGDYNLRSLPDHMDFSSSVIPYTKAVEVALHKLIFEPFRTSYSDRDCRNEFLQKFMRGEKELTLGSYMIILSSSRETALRGFISRIVSDVEALATTLNDTAMRDVRNKAAHDEVLSRDEAQQTRTWAIEILGMV